MTTCEACGTDVPAGNGFCTSCGAMLADPVPGGDPATGIERTGVAAEFLSWERKIPLITNPYLVLQGIFIPLGLGFILGLIFWLITGASEMLLMFLIVGGFLAIVFLLVMLVLQLVTGGLLTTFFISSEGVAHKAGSATKGLDAAATAGSVLLGSVSGTGAGLLAMSQEFNTLEWSLVRYISVYPRVRSVVFRQPYLISPVVLYCTEENFSQVLAMIRKYAPPAAARNL
jgi:hypothetical protein